MQICYNCRSKQLDGTIFCSECGASLLEESRGKAVPETAPPIDSGAAPDVGASPVETISLVVLPSGRRIILQVTDEALIGRKDDARGIIPDIDLGKDGGYDAGVSRRHAIILYRDGRYRVEDLGSANGTFVNEQPLTPGTPVLIQNGDELKCGTLAMRLEIT